MITLTQWLFICPFQLQLKAQDHGKASPSSSPLLNGAGMSPSAPCMVGVGAGSINPPPDVTGALGDLFKMQILVSFAWKGEMARLGEPSLLPF